jgi:glycosyltransferase involved in cell wall biosynthesis
MDKVSVIIPTYNRFKYLLNAIESVINQTYTNIEIIVVNDCSTQKEYYEYDFKAKYGDNFTIIHLEQNSKSKFGFACVGFVINKGLEIYSGDYFSTCDDDDIWFPNKIELQIKAMKESGCKMSCTDGLIGEGIYDKNKKYQKYNAEFYYNELQNIYKNKGSKLLENGFPEIWNYEFINIHNCIIACSVIIHKDIMTKISKQLEIKMGGDLINNEIVYIDYEYWLRALKHTNCIYVNDICIYYDNGHGGGKNY